MTNNIPTICEKCGGKMIERKGKKKDGTSYHFWGCENFTSKGCGFTWNPPKPKKTEEAVSNDERLFDALRNIWLKLDEILEVLKK